MAHFSSTLGHPLGFKKWAISFPRVAWNSGNELRFSSIKKQKMKTNKHTITSRYTNRNTQNKPTHPPTNKQTHKRSNIQRSDSNDIWRRREARVKRAKRAKRRARSAREASAARAKRARSVRESHAEGARSARVGAEKGRGKEKAKVKQPHGLEVLRISNTCL